MKKQRCTKPACQNILPFIEKREACPYCGGSIEEIQFSYRDLDAGATIYKNKSGAEFMEVVTRSKAVSLEKMLKHMGAAIMLAIITITATAQDATYRAPMTVQTLDNAGNEIGYFHLDTIARKAIQRGSQYENFYFIYTRVMLPAWKIKNAAEMVLDYVNPDGTIKDPALFKIYLYQYLKMKNNPL